MSSLYTRLSLRPSSWTKTWKTDFQQQHFAALRHMTYDIIAAPPQFSPSGRDGQDGRARRRGGSVARGRAGERRGWKGQRSWEVCLEQVCDAVPQGHVGRLDTWEALSAVTPPASPLKLRAELLSSHRHVFHLQHCCDDTRNTFIAKLFWCSNTGDQLAVLYGKVQYTYVQHIHK